MDHIELWDKAKALMREELANVSYTTWIEQPLKPVYVVDDKLALEVISDFNEKTIRARYLSMITAAVSQAAGREMTIELMSVKERIEWQERQKKEEAPAMQGINMFNPKSTFDTFVVGSSNRFAHAAALAVAEQPGVAYNPLFLYGGVGLGKTHLMHAIGHFIQEHFPNMRMLYLPSEMFTNELVAAIKNNKNVEFRNRFRNVDVLMLDDIQFIAGRDSTQEEFFHTFNALHSAGKQIIISSDKPPREIARLEERLRSRFEWGLIADIQKPDFDTRVAILRKKADNEDIEVSDEMLELIAGRIESNIRELEGSLTRVNAYAKLNHCDINEEVISRHQHSSRSQTHHAGTDYRLRSRLLRDERGHGSQRFPQKGNRAGPPRRGLPDPRDDQPQPAAHRRRLRPGSFDDHQFLRQDHQTAGKPARYEGRHRRSEKDDYREISTLGLCPKPWQGTEFPAPSPL